MANRLDRLGRLKLSELEIFYFTAKAKSIREVARRLTTSPGQISKTVKGLERKIRAPLFVRSASGTVLSETGTRLLEHAEAILDNAYQMESSHLGGNGEERQTLGVAATSFLITHLVAPTLSAEFTGKYQMRMHDFAPDTMISAALRGAFDLAFHFGKMDWPRTWESEKLGAVKWALYVRQEHPLKPSPRIADVLKFPFVVPTYWTSEGLVRGNDFYEITLSERELGTETSTAEAAVPVLLRTDQVAFLPSLLVRDHISSGRLRAVRPRDGRRIEKELFVTVKTQTMPAKLFTMVKSRARTLLEAELKR